MMTINKLVPFGKYKGQPVEVMTQDKEYCEWLMGQDWFRSRNPELVTIIINQSGEPVETPEHNALQARFLDEDFRHELLNKINDSPFSPEDTIAYFNRVKEFEGTVRKNLDQINGETHSDEDYYYVKPSLCRDGEMSFWLNGTLIDLGLNSSNSTYGKIRSTLNNALHQIQKYLSSTIDERIERAKKEYYQKSGDVEFEYYGFDVLLQGRAGQCYFIECKTSLGDDYPAVLRQMKVASNRAPRYSAQHHEGAPYRTSKTGKMILLVENYAGQGASIEQVRKIFRTSEIEMIMLKEIEIHNK